MAKYKIKTPREQYYIDADDLEQASRDVLGREDIKVEEHQEGKFVFLNQNDYPRVYLGTTTHSVKRYGCTITSLCMHSGWYGKFVDVATAAKKLKFTRDGLLYWSSIDKVMPFKFVYRYYYRDAKKLRAILGSKDGAAIVEVNYAGAKHWLALIGYSRIYGFKCADPLTGAPIYVERKYGKITGFAEVTRK